MTALELEGVDTYYGRQRVLKGFTLSVAAGQHVAVTGPNGSGKTTLLKALLGQVRFSGRVRIHGRPVRRADAGMRRSLAYVPQVPAFPAGVTGMEFVAFVQRLRGLRVDPGPVLERAGLAPAAHQVIRTYSGGMLRRLALGLTTLEKTALVLLDEPDAGLDPPGQTMLLEQFEHWRREGATVLFTVHRTDRLPAVDRVLNLEAGRLQADVPGTAAGDRLVSLTWSGPRLALEDIAARCLVARLPHRPVLPRAAAVLTVKVPERRLVELLAALHPLPRGVEMTVAGPSACSPTGGFAGPRVPEPPSAAGPVEAACGKTSSGTRA